MPCVKFHLSLWYQSKDKKYYAMKLQKKSESVTPFAGISFVIEVFNICGLSTIIDNNLGIRCLSSCQYSEICTGWFSVFFSGGDVAEDINCHLRESLSTIPDNRVPSADTLFRGIKELSTESDTVKSTSGTEEINYKKYQLASIEFTSFMGDSNFKFMVMREKNSDGQMDLFTGDDFIYRCILTNDHEFSEKETVEYYNKGGGKRENI